MRWFPLRDFFLWKSYSYRKKNLNKCCKCLLSAYILHCHLKDYLDGYFWRSLGKHFFAGFFRFLFSWAKQKIHREKNPQRLNENSSKVRRNTNPQEHWKNQPKRREWQNYTYIGKVDMLSDTQNSVITNTGQDLKISKNRFNESGGQVGSLTGENNISTGWNIGKLDIRQLGCRTSLMFTCSSFWKFEIFGQVGCRTCDM